MIKLSDHFTYGKLLRFVLPSVAMMIFTSIYGVVDGYFVSNYTGKTSFAAVNLIYPVLMILGTVGFMFGAGGSALVAKTMGERDSEKANSIFSLLIAVSTVVSIILSVLGIIFLRPVAIALGAEGTLLQNAVLYGRIILIALPGFVLQLGFQSFLIAAERPKLGLVVTLGAGLANMLLDALLVGVLKTGLVGAAIATAVSQILGGLIPFVYFLRPNKSALRLKKFKFDSGAIWKTCTNGCSEFMNNIAMSFVSMLYNAQLMKYEGENGIAAYGVLMYVGMVFSAAFIGYSIGSAPIVSFNYGAQNHTELRGLLKKSTVLIALCAAVMVTLALSLSGFLSNVFVGYDPQLAALTHRAFWLYSFAFIPMGFAMFASGFFTALNDGVTSAILSFLRTLVFQVSAVFLLPLIMGIDGIWLSVFVAELLALIVSIVFLLAKQKRFGY